MDTIICVTEEEAACFQSDDQRGFAVRLSFQTDEPIEDLAKQRFETFVRQLGQMRFGLYRLDNGTLHRVNGVVLHAEPHDAGLADQLLGWLPSQQPAGAAMFYRTPALTEPIEVTASTVDARAVLLGIASATAPVPHRLRLAVVLRVPRTELAPTPDASVVVLPHVTGDLPDTLPGAGAVLGGTIVLEAAGVRCQSSVTFPVAALSTKVDLAQGFVEADGFSQEAHLTVERLERRIGSLLSGHLATHEIQWPDLPGGDAGIPPELGPSSAEERSHVRRLSWRAVTALASVLDTVMIALAMPGATQRDGALLAPFLDGLAARVVDEHNRGVERGRLRGALRAGMTQWPVIKSPGATPDERRKLIEAICAVCKIAPPPLQDKADTSWLSWLLLGYIAEDGETWHDIAQRGRALGIGDGADRPTDLRALWARQSRELERELALLRDSSTGEAGLEAIVVQLLRDPGLQQTFWTQLGLTPPADNPYVQALDAYERQFVTGADGATAARQAVGSLVADFLVPGTFTGPPSAELQRNFEDVAFWARRFQIIDRPTSPARPDSAPLFAALSWPFADPARFFAEITAPNSLPLDWQVPSPAEGDARQAIETAARDMTESVVNDLFPPGRRRYVPDAVPPSVAIQVAVDPTADDGSGDADDFAACFSGVALLLRRRDRTAVDPPWAYACLAEVLGPNKAPWTPDVRTVQPLPATVCDGRRALFVPYDGLPFATLAFEDTLPEGSADGTKREGFYQVDYPSDVGNKGTALPPLAYGTAVEVAAHALGRAGSLPLSLQDARPWIPVDLPSLPHSQGFHETIRYTRTTAIGSPQIGDSGTTARIGIIPADTQPLLTDYPQVAVVSGLALDLCRNADGTGAIAIPGVGTSEELELSELRAFCAAGQRLQLDVAPMANADADFKFPTNSAEFVSLSLKYIARLKVVLSCEVPGEVAVDFVADGAAAHRAVLATDSRSLWLRLKIANAELRDCISLADPARELRGPAAASRPSPSNLLLLGSSQAGAWRSPYGSKTQVRVGSPSVPYVDWVRWISNPRLHDQVFGTTVEERRRALAFRTLLLAAHIDRMKAPELAALLDQLPDPAVGNLRIDVSPVDGLRVDTRTLQETLRADTALRPLPTLGELLRDDDDLWQDVKKRNAVSALRRIRNTLALTIAIDVVADGPLELSDRADRLSMPEGTCAHLAVRPVVPIEHFEVVNDAPAPVLHRRLRELALGDQKEGVVFEGAALQLEAMLGPLRVGDEDHDRPVWQDSRAAWCKSAMTSAISHKGATATRRYGLEYRPADAGWRWRHIGAVTVATQRWRFNGRPIDTWISPPPRKTRGRATSVALPWDESLKAFESDAFGTRDARDADLTTIRLQPAPAPTQLIDVAWEAPSATIFRHRFELRSRYLGAMRRHMDGLVEAWSDEENGSQAWRRVAMLADRARVTLTRPQLRALVPLTAPIEKDPGATPPVLALLQERPYHHGGLADRVAAEIRTGVGYGWLDPPKVVGPLDARKELGPDPRLAYEAADQDSAAAMFLETRGPLGLTFEPQISAPAFPNAAYVLSPRLVDVGGSRAAHLDEHLLSVGLRRYLDPAWLVEEETQTQSPLATTWWGPADLEGPRPWQIVLHHAEERRPFLRCQKAADSAHLDVLLQPWAVDHTSPTQAQELLVARVPVNARLAFLHTPLDERRASLALLLLRKDLAADLLASLDWTLPKEIQAAELALEDENGAPLAVIPTSASAVTALNWTRLLRNSDAITALQTGEKIETSQPKAVSDLHGVISQGAFMFRDEAQQLCWIRARQQGQRYPLHMQRHIGLLFSREHTGLGAPMSVPSSACMAPFRQTPFDGIPATHVQVLELEMPARILGHIPGGDTADYLPHDFRQAYFDLKAIGFEGSRIGREGAILSFFGRFVGSRDALTRLKSLHLKLRGNDESDGMELELSRASTDVELTGFILSVQCRTDGLAVNASFIDVNGQRINPLPIGPQAWRPGSHDQLQGLLVQFAQAPTDELWIELSLLVSRLSDVDFRHDGPIDFDWFFGEPAGNPVLDVGETSLRTLREAQARLIAVSPPVKIEPT
ncbi:hypothetical protein HIV01_012310 [Lysobacter arenosi]|uniref:Uncharacterized protein n=1 Tax=Lysobacter arenosi TaxID=2795387 RepID=A0ABX7R799_9GAMM|nr:hypothetical protein [Lysobacter arenosi]QSX74000.1 hypothetical protein HIV01_012310 [Lysobacter arenosi]